MSARLKEIVDLMFAEQRRGKPTVRGVTELTYRYLNDPSWQIPWSHHPSNAAKPQAERINEEYRIRTVMPTFDNEGYTLAFKIMKWGNEF